MAESIGVVVGAGQAGLSASRELGQRGIEHVVLERGRIGQSWRDRWDSFCLVTPNWTIQLPGGAYSGDDPDGFMPRDAIVAHLVGYAAGFVAPVREGVEVTSLRRHDGGGFRMTTSAGEIQADTVVLATGAYQRPHRPPGAASLPNGLHVIDAEAYANPSSLPPGAVLIVGSGQTGCQLAEELHQAGRDVVLACGRAPWGPRRLQGRDIVHWLLLTGYMDVGLAELPNPVARLGGNIQLSGHDGGHELNYRTLQAMGVTLVGRFLGAENGRLRFASDLSDSVAFGDARYRDLAQFIRRSCEAQGIAAPELPEPPQFHAAAPEALDMGGLGTVIFTSGFRPDYSSWVDIPGAFDDLGFPVHTECASTVAPGLHFVGVHFLRKRKSSLLLGVAEDAAIVAGRIATPVEAV